MPNIPLDRTITRFCNSYSMIFGRKTSAGEADEQLKGEKCSTMRHSFHRALTTCRAPLPPGKKYVGVQFLTKEIIFYVVDTKGKGQEVFEEASKHLGLLDTELFGLAFFQDGDYIFIDLNLKVSKYAVRSWKTQNNGVGCDGQPLLMLHMRIKYYVDCHLLISEKVVRHHYYLQLRENVKNYAQPISEEKSFLLAALALQADLGNYEEEKHKSRYFEIANYFPSWIIAKIGEEFIIRYVPALHKDNVGLSRGEAEVGYIKEASDTTAPHNLHFYKMRRKKGKVWGSVWLGIQDSGLDIYEQFDQESTKSLLSSFLWCDIAKLHFEKKKFEILSEGSPDYRRFTYFAQSEELAKHLLWICRTTHHFHMANQNRVADLKKLELDGGKPYREVYIYTDKVDQAWEKKQNTLLKSKLKAKIENSTINFNGMDEHLSPEKSLNGKMSGLVWNMNSFDNKNTDQSLPIHHSMEVLPFANGCKLSSDIKYKSQSISCFSDRSLAPCTNKDGGKANHLWKPDSNLFNTPTSVISRSSCTSYTDSTCSTLSLTAGTATKVGDTLTSIASNDGNHWVKCESFEEIPLENDGKEKIMHKVCISTFVDKHVRTASVYDAVPHIKTHSFKPVVSSSSTISLSTKYVTSSLGTSSVVKTSDVRRTPSLNVCSTSSNFSNHTNILDQVLLSKPKMHSTVNNAQIPISSHGRTATRIGVSSLSRDQKSPLVLFNERHILACGSEPNLYAPIMDNNSVTLTNQSAVMKSQWLQRNLNSRSEMALNVIDNCSVSQCSDSIGSGHENSDTRTRQLSLPDVCSDIVDGEFPCIPPPPAYRNEISGLKASTYSHFHPSVTNKEYGHQSLSNTETHKELRSTYSSPPDVLDIQQLRQRSRDLDLPLISALCNDRSLLMLPKTVPTCSRQRHIGSNDPLRFSRTTSLPNGDGSDILLPKHCRPISWHVESARSPHWIENRISSWDSSIKSAQPQLSALEIQSPTVTSTILTSFGKSPLKSVRSVLDSTESYRNDKIQMIPTKLLAGSLSNISNGRLYHKGLSS